MAAGNLSVVEPHRTRAVPAQGHWTGHELEPFTLVGPLNHKQGGHERFVSWAGAPERKRLANRLFSLIDPTPAVNRRGAFPHDYLPFSRVIPVS